MKTVTIQLEDDLAARFMQLTDVQKKEVEGLIALWVKKPRNILEVMTEVSDYAKSQGLTPEILEDLLKDE
jgi:hypothetical protein